MYVGNLKTKKPCGISLNEMNNDNSTTHKRRSNRNSFIFPKYDDSLESNFMNTVQKNSKKFKSNVLAIPKGKDV